MILGTELTKIEVLKKKGKKEKININNNIKIKGVVDADISLGDKDQKGIKFQFIFTSKYKPEIGKITIEGEVLYLNKADQIKEIQESWKKDKKVKEEVIQPVLNSALRRSNIQALKLADDVNLPFPIPLPKIQGQKKEKK